MDAAGASTLDLVERIDQLRRAHPLPVRPSGLTRPEAAQVLRIHGVGVASDAPVMPEFPPRSTAEPLLVGLRSVGSPFVMVLDGEHGRLRIDLGVWKPGGWGSPGMVERGFSALTSLLASTYSHLDAAPPVREPARGGQLTEGGLGYGVPTVKSLNVRDGTNQIDRLVRGLRGSRWRVVVLAQPVDEHYVTSLRDNLIGEMRAVGTTSASMYRSSVATPLEEHYSRYQALWLDALRSGLDLGMWRVAVYLVGDAEGYPRLASTWRAEFSGPDSMPEPVRVVHDQHAPSLAADWAMPDTFAEGASSTLFVPPFEHQTLLSSPQLAAYVDLPRLETSGFEVHHAAAFDSVAPAVASMHQAVDIGKVVENGIVGGDGYRVDLPSLTRHAFVAGVTGSGKTNTVMHLIKQVDRGRVPFLVIEPAKREYRQLLGDPDLLGPLFVLTPGDERLVPLRLNPFEPEPGTALNVHIDLLRSLFGVSLGMWTPLPQVLEKALHLIYARRGWDITANHNTRLGESKVADAYPTLSELVTAVEELVPGLGYGREVEGNVLGALRTRLGSLCTGGKGRMLDTARSLPMEILLGRSTVLELEPLGDDDDKAFVMGLLLLRLAEYRRRVGRSRNLKHLLVIEEAHRLLRNVGDVAREESADPQRKAVETFSNLLAEVRAYGQGVVVVDQVPTKLAPDVVKNTNLKIAHRIVAADDRAVIGGAMAMNESQVRSLASLGLGRAAVFGAGDDAPVLIQVPAATVDTPIADDAVASQRESVYPGWETLLVGCPTCTEAAGSTSTRLCDIARELAKDPSLSASVARLAISVADMPGSRERLWADVEAGVLAARPSDVDAGQLCAATFAHAADRIVSRWGAMRGWTYDLTNALKRALVEAVLSPDASAIQQYSRTWSKAHEVDCFPLPRCASVCTPQGDGVLRCPYRDAVLDAVSLRRHTDAYQEAIRLDTREPAEAPLSRVWRVAAQIAGELVEFPVSGMVQQESDAARDQAFRVALCAGQHLLASDQTSSWSHRRARIDLLIEEYG